MEFTEWIYWLSFFFICNCFRYVPPPPSRPRYRENTGFDAPNPNDVVHDPYNSIDPISNEIATNEVADFDANNNKLSYYAPYVPKYFKISGKYANDVYKAKYYSKFQKYNVIAYKDKYQNVPYFVVSWKSSGEF